MNRKLPALFLALSLTLALPSLAAELFFPKTTEMPGFTDISSSGSSGGAWYDYESVKTCVESGLMKGTDKGFAPGGDITLAEVATIAARINEKTTGYALPAHEPGKPWYAPALAVMEHLGISVGSDPAAKATRADFVRILSAVLPDRMMAPINTITSLPDSKDAAVLRFYNAGLLEGRDAYGTFDGASTLRRSECAAMLARIINPDLRKLLSLAFSPSSLTAPETDASSLPVQDALPQNS